MKHLRRHRSLDGSPAARFALVKLLLALLTVLAACAGGSVPAAPTDVTVTPVAGGLRVDWTSDAVGVTGFKVYREAVGLVPGDLSPLAYSEIAALGADARSYYDFEVALDTSYRYSVSAVGAGGESVLTPQSDPTPVTPMPGIDLFITISGAGTVSASGGGEGFACTQDCVLAFAQGTAVTLSAAGASGEEFATWLGDCSGASDCSFVLTEERSIEAAFSSNVLRLVLDGDTPVSVTVSPAHGGQGTSQCLLGVDQACGYGYPGPVAVSVNATLLEADQGAEFLGFGPVCTSPQGRYCVVNSSGGVTELSIRAVRSPVAVGETFDLFEDVPLAVGAGDGVLVNDSDTPGDVLTAVLVTAPEHGELALDPDGSFDYVPGPDFSGVDGFDYRARDAYGNESTAVRVTLNVASVNDAPSFVIPADPPAYPDGPRPRVVIAGFATAIVPGPADESSQTLAFSVVREGSAGPGFIEEPAISPAGTLTFQHQPGTVGTATFIVTLQDNGGTANGGVDTSEPATFQITANPLTLTIAVSGSGSGTVSPAPGTHAYAYGETVRVNATPASGSRRTDWGGACNSVPAGSPNCDVEMTANRDASVEFTAVWRLNVSLLTPSEGTVATGTVSSQTQGVTVGCGNFLEAVPRTCAGADVLDGQIVDLSYLTLSQFVGWGGDCPSGVGEQCSVLMNGHRTVTATFSP